MEISRPLLRSMSAMRMTTAYSRQQIKPYSSPEFVQRVAHFILHKCKDHISAGSNAPAGYVALIQWDDLFAFAPEDIVGFSHEKGEPLFIALVDGRALDLTGLYADFLETWYRLDV